MPTYNVVASKDGSIRLLTRDQMDERAEKNPPTKANERELGSFTAENMQEARRLFVTLNPAVDLTDTGMRLVVQVGQATSDDEKVRATADEHRKALEDLRQSAIDTALDNLRLPEGGDPNAYSDEAHEARGEMLSREERDAARQDAEQPRGQNVAGGGEFADRNRTGQTVLGNTGKQGGQPTSRGARTGGQGAGVTDAGSPNAGTAGPVSGATGPGVGNQGTGSRQGGGSGGGTGQPSGGGQGGSGSSSTGSQK